MSDTYYFEEIVPLFVDEGFETHQAEAAADLLDGSTVNDVRMVLDVIRAIFEAEENK